MSDPGASQPSASSTAAATTLSLQPQTPKSSKTCNICFKLFASAPALSRHRQDIHLVQPKRLYVCPLCKESAKNKYFYREHLLKSHSTKLLEEKHVFDTYNEFIAWKDTMERTTKTYFIRSRVVNAENRYDEYYNCHRSGSRSLDVDPEARTKTGKLVKARSKKVGGLCPATIKVNFSEAKHQFIVQYCSTHVGHALDSEIVAKMRKGSKLFESQDADKVRRDEEAMAIDSIVLGCAMGCPELPVCQHVQGIHVEEGPGSTSSSGTLDSEIITTTITPVEIDLNNIDVTMIENLINTYGTTTTSDGHQIINLPPEMTQVHITPVPTVDILTTTSTTTTTTCNPNEVPNGTAAFDEVVTSTDPEINIMSSYEQFLLKNLLDQPKLTHLFRDIVSKTNEANFEFIKNKLLEVIGTLDSLELIDSYLKPKK